MMEEGEELLIKQRRKVFTGESPKEAGELVVKAPGRKECKN